MRSKFTSIQKLFLLWRETGDKIDQYVLYRVFSVWSNRKGRRLTKLQVNTKNQITPKQLILATDFQWTFKEQFSFKFQDNLKIQNKYYILKCESYTPQNW